MSYVSIYWLTYNCTCISIHVWYMCTCMCIHVDCINKCVFDYVWRYEPVKRSLRRVLMKIILGKFKVLQRDMRRDEMWRSPSPSRSPGSLPDVRRQRPKVWQGQRRRARNPGGWLCSLRFGHRDAAVRRDHRWESHGLVSSQIDLIGCS